MTRFVARCGVGFAQGASGIAVVSPAAAKRQHGLAASFIVDQEASLFQGASRIGGPRIASLAGGSIVYVWSAMNVDDSSLGIAVRMFDTLGNAITPQFTANTFTTRNQQRPDVTALADGGFLVAWESFAQDSSGFGVYFRRYDSLGFALNKAEEQANVESLSSQFTCSVASLPSSGGWVIAWNSFDQDGDDGGIFARVWSADGGGGEEFQVNDYEEGAQTNPRVASVPSGRWLITWVSFNQDSEEKGASSVYAKIYEPGPAIKGSKEIKINLGTIGQNLRPTAIGLETKQGEDAGFVVAYEYGGGSNKTRPDIGLVHVDVKGGGYKHMLANQQTKFSQIHPTVAQSGNSETVRPPRTLHTCGPSGCVLSNCTCWTVPTVPFCFFLVVLIPVSPPVATGRRDVGVKFRFRAVLHSEV